MDFFAGVVDFFVNVLGDVFITWMQRLAALDRKRYVVVYILLLLAIAAGAGGGLGAGRVPACHRADHSAPFGAASVRARPAQNRMTAATPPGSAARPGRR